jgi:Family of unknown function (DUF6221)
MSTPETPQVSGLVEQLREVIDTDERIARAANPSPWRFRIDGATHLDQSTIFGADHPGGLDKLRHVCSVDMAWERDANAAHIIRHDPARTLAMVAAHRALIDEILALQAKIDDEWGDPAEPTPPHEITGLVLLAKAYGIQP